MRRLAISLLSVFLLISENARAQTDDYYCGTSYNEATESCALPCPSGDDADCSDALGSTYVCYFFTGCAEKIANGFVPAGDDPSTQAATEAPVVPVAEVETPSTKPSVIAETDAPSDQPSVMPPTVEPTPLITVVSTRFLTPQPTTEAINAFLPTKKPTPKTPIIVTSAETAVNLLLTLRNTPRRMLYFKEEEKLKDELIDFVYTHAWFNLMVEDVTIWHQEVVEWKENDVRLLQSKGNQEFGSTAITLILKVSHCGKFSDRAIRKELVALISEDEIDLLDSLGGLDTYPFFFEVDALHAKLIEYVVMPPPVSAPFAKESKDTQGTDSSSKGDYIGIGIGALVLVLGIGLSYRALKHRYKEKQKKELSKRTLEADDIEAGNVKQYTKQESLPKDTHESEAFDERKLASLDTEGGSYLSSPLSPMEDISSDSDSSSDARVLAKVKERRMQREASKLAMGEKPKSRDAAKELFFGSSDSDASSESSDGRLQAKVQERRLKREMSRRAERLSKSDTTGLNYTTKKERRHSTSLTQSKTDRDLEGSNSYNLRKSQTIGSGLNEYSTSFNISGGSDLRGSRRRLTRRRSSRTSSFSQSRTSAGSRSLSKSNRSGSSDMNEDLAQQRTGDLRTSVKKSRTSGLRRSRNSSNDLRISKRLDASQTSKGTRSKRLNTSETSRRKRSSTNNNNLRRSASLQYGSGDLRRSKTRKSSDDLLRLSSTGTQRTSLRASKRISDDGLAELRLASSSDNMQGLTSLRRSSTRGSSDNLWRSARQANDLRLSKQDGAGDLRRSKTRKSSNDLLQLSSGGTPKTSLRT